jgi:hypothetical protein
VVWSVETSGRGVVFCKGDYPGLFASPLKLLQKTPFSWTANLHRDDKGQTVALVRSSVVSGEPVELLYRVVREDGTVHWLTHQVRPVWEKDRVVRVNHLVWYRHKDAEVVPLKLDEAREGKPLKEMPKSVPVVVAPPPPEPEPEPVSPQRFPGQPEEEEDAFLAKLDSQFSPFREIPVKPIPPMPVEFSEPVLDEVLIPDVQEVVSETPRNGRGVVLIGLSGGLGMLLEKKLEAFGQRVSVFDTVGAWQEEEALRPACFVVDMDALEAAGEDPHVFLGGEAEVYLLVREEQLKDLQEVEGFALLQKPLSPSEVLDVLALNLG